MSKGDILMSIRKVVMALLVAQVILGGFIIFVFLNPVMGV